LMIRIAETTTGHTWNRIREDLQELHVGTFEGPAGTFRQRTELTTAQRDIPAALTHSRRSHHSFRVQADLQLRNPGSCDLLIFVE
jgi:hypothetical protein